MYTYTGNDDRKKFGIDDIEHLRHTLEIINRTVNKLDENKIDDLRSALENFNRTVSQLSMKLNGE